MKTIAKLLSALALAGTILPSGLYLVDGISLPALKIAMLAATIVWFATVPFWMGREDGPSGSKT